MSENREKDKIVNAGWQRGKPKRWNSKRRRGEQKMPEGRSNRLQRTEYRPFYIGNHIVEHMKKCSIQIWFYMDTFVG